MPRFLFLCALSGACILHGYEYHLQFTPAGSAFGLQVAGYAFSGETVTGNCSYYTATARSGRGSHGTITYHYNACTWDLFGNLISLTPVSAAPAAPAVLSTSGTETIYATNDSSTTGRDTRGFGFVSTPSTHYSWVTPNATSAVIPWAVYTLSATLTSDGDFPLNFSGAAVTAGVSGTITPSPGTATVSGTTCGSVVATGTSCSVTITYDPTSIKCTPSPYGYAYTKITLLLVADAGANTDFTQRFTITGVPVCGD